uniref:Uncharacterized protein n=1 Tax=Erythrolobus australicus TaxID=1077150 RepID=A0A7S1XJM5_9RHOD|mmetsp:Transcript_5062/g.13611  ORF Transcript_5062/g.13611 Transcript_5062/m.13611 type:complete len:493 (+) Transcript_5062:230-1708(+)
MAADDEYEVVFQTDLGRAHPDAADVEVLLIGNHGSVGAWKMADACSATASDGRCFKWVLPMTRKSLEALEYKYVLRFKSDQSGADAPLWWPLYRPNLRVDSADWASKQLVIDDTVLTVNFKMYLALPSHEALYVCGSHAALGSWKRDRALRLSRGPDDRWTGSVQLPRRASRISEPIEFKYLIGSEHSATNARYEARTNRLLDLEAAAADDEAGAEASEVLLYHAWDATIVRVVMFHPLPDGFRLGVIGSLPAFGDWKRPAPMGLGHERRTLTGNRARCWELTFPVDGSGVGPVVYRYAQLNTKNDTAVWEREPNRELTVPSTTELPSGVFEQFDGNFVSGMDIDRVSRDILLGPYPQVESDVDEIIAAGAGAVLNVQTETDFYKRQIDWDLLSACYERKGIPVVLHPIEDFDGSSLEKHLLAAAAHVKKFVDQGLCVYIHCTAGMGRAPAVAIAHMVQAENISSAEALQRIKSVRPKVGPNMAVIESVLQR